MFFGTNGASTIVCPPSSAPTTQPSNQPTGQPTSQPSVPTSQPTSQPTIDTSFKKHFKDEVEGVIGNVKDSLSQMNTGVRSFTSFVNRAIRPDGY